MKASFSFKLKQNKTSNLGYVPIILRVSINSKRAEFNTKEKIEPKDWINGNHIEKWSKKPVLNKSLFSIYKRAKEYYSRFEENEVEFTSQDIVDLLQGKRNSSKKSLLEAFDYHNERMFLKVPKDYAISTYTRYLTTKYHIQKFMKETYNKDDISLNDLNFEFISDFELYMTTKRNCCHNTAIKYIKNVKKITNLAINLKWLNKDPFSAFECIIDPVETKFLTDEEVKIMKEKKISIKRLDVVRDNYLFCCYTGLSFIDLVKLSKNQISIVNGTDYMLIYFRNKTEERAPVPLDSDALEIIKKYEQHPDVESTNRVLPIISSQKNNAYLKEISTICGLDEKLNWHSSRHTFATSLLTRGASYEVVAKMMGHRNLNETKKYARLLDKRIIADFKALDPKI